MPFTVEELRAQLKAARERHAAKKAKAEAPAAPSPPMQKYTKAELLAQKARADKLAIAKSKLKKATAMKRLAKALRTHIAKKRMQKLPEDVENIIKKQVGDPNKMARVKRFETQMKGLMKLIEKLEHFTEYSWSEYRIRAVLMYQADWGRHTFDWNKLKKDDTFNNMPKYLNDVMDVYKKIYTYDNAEDEDDSHLKTFIECLQSIHEAGMKFLNPKVKNKFVSVIDEDFSPYERIEVTLDDWENFDVFAIPLRFNEEVTPIDEDEDEEEEQDERPYHLELDIIFELE